MNDAYLNWLYMMEKMQSIKYFSNSIILHSTKQYKIPAEHLNLLSHLSVYNDKITPKNLSKIMNVNKTIISRIIETLHNQGYIKKINDEDDKRSYFVEITPSGKEKLDNIYLHYLGPLYKLRRKLGDDDFFKLIEAIEDANKKIAEE